MSSFPPDASQGSQPEQSAEGQGAALSHVGMRSPDGYWVWDGTSWVPAATWTPTVPPEQQTVWQPPEETAGAAPAEATAEPAAETPASPVPAEAAPLESTAAAAAAEAPAATAPAGGMPPSGEPATAGDGEPLSGTPERAQLFGLEAGAAAEPAGTAATTPMSYGTGAATAGAEPPAGAPPASTPVPEVQPPAYGQPAYGQTSPYGQPPAYGQPAAPYGAPGWGAAMPAAVYQPPGGTPPYGAVPVGYMPPGHPGATPGGYYDVSVVFTPPPQRSRLYAVPLFGGLVRFIMIIPHVIVLYFVGILAVVASLVLWAPVLVVGRYPRWGYAVVGGYVRWYARMQAFIFGLTDSYPPFRLRN